MPRLLSNLLPWNWFGGNKALPASHDAPSMVAGVKRKRDGEEEEGRISKRSRLSEEKLQALTQQGGPKPGSATSAYWTTEKFRRWRSKSRQTLPTSSSTGGHDSSITAVEAQNQLQQEDANDGETISPPKRSMPPPPRPDAKRRRVQRVSDLSNVSQQGDHFEMGDITTMSVAASTASKRLGQADAFDLEQARRHAAATRLPENSGIWAQTETELFYHLAMRGFEPLLAQNWMVDFKTLPITLFATEGTDPPLIQVQSGTTFRAVRALRELIETGKIVRDKSLSSPKSSIEGTLEKSIRQYFSWAISDGSFNTFSDDYIPNYIIFTRRRGQSTANAIKHLNDKLRKLAARHRERLDLQPSTQADDQMATFPSPTPISPANGTKATRVYDDTERDPNAPPTLYGILIVSTILVIFTLNSQNALNSPSTNDIEDIDNAGLRYIEKFDFSNASHDVWNALVIAIVAVEVRSGLGRCGFEKLIRDENGSVMVKHDTESVAGDSWERRKHGGDDVFVSGKAKGKKVVNRGWFGRGGVVKSIETDQTQNETEVEPDVVMVDDDPDR